MRLGPRIALLGLSTLWMPQTLLATSLRGHGRLLAGSTTLTTTSCNVVRLEDYQAELQLVYSYLVEFAAGGSRSLHGLEEAIAHAVSQELDACDILDRPLYRIKTNTRHEFSKEEFCAPFVDGNTCNVITGATAILLDNDSALVQAKAYHAIEVGLNNTDFIHQFSNSAVRAQFVKPLRQSLVISPEPESPTPPGTVTATVAVAAASVSFIVASIFCYGLMRREMRHHPEPSVRHKNRIRKSARTVVSNHIGMNRRRNFVRLEEFAQSPVAFEDVHFTINPPQHTPSITWSISDITSDSASLYSSLSRTTSKLERIEEEEEADDEYEDIDYEEDSNDMIYLPHGNIEMPITHLYGMPSGPIEFIDFEQFSCMDLHDEPLEFIELEGCQYVEEADEGRGVRAVTPVEMLDGHTHDFEPVMPEVDDLQISLDDDEDDSPYEPAPSILGGTVLAPSPKVDMDEDSVYLEALANISPTIVGEEVPLDAEVTEMEEPASGESVAVKEIGIIDDDTSHGKDPNKHGNSQNETIDANPNEDEERVGSECETTKSRPAKDGQDDDQKECRPSTCEDSTVAELSFKSADERHHDTRVGPETPTVIQNSDDTLEVFFTPMQELHEKETDSTVLEECMQDDRQQEWVSQMVAVVSQEDETSLTDYMP